MLCHDFKEHQGTAYIIFIVLQGYGNRLTNSFQAGKMDDRVNFRLLKNPIKTGFIQQVNFMKFKFSAADLLDAPDGFFPAVYQAINHYNFIAGQQ